MLRTWYTKLRYQDRVVIHDGQRTLAAVTVRSVGNGQVKLEFDVDERLKIQSHPAPRREKSA